jgi:hypothetical protein
MSNSIICYSYTTELDRQYKKINLYKFVVIGNTSYSKQNIKFASKKNCGVFRNIDNKQCCFSASKRLVIKRFAQRTHVHKFLNVAFQHFWRCSLYTYTSLTKGGFPLT